MRKLMSTRRERGQDSEMDKLLQRVLDSLEQQNIDYCLLRGYDELEQIDAREVDLLVRRNQLTGVCDLLKSFGFVRLPSWGHAPHNFFVTYNGNLDKWLKLDVVTEIAYGRPIHALYTPLSGDCLKNRCRRESAFTPSPEDELITLLLHCVVDKADISPREGQRLKLLCDQVNDSRRASWLLMTYYSREMNFSRTATLIHRADWETLIARRKETIAYLTRLDPLGVFFGTIRDRVLRKLHRMVQAVHPHAITVALLAPDGAGKSTLATSIQQSFLFPVHSIYMGLYSGRRNGSGANVQDTSTRTGLPGLGLLRHLFLQWKRYLYARYQLACGHLVIFDRYTYDALLPLTQPPSKIKLWRRWLLAHACPAPDLVVFLDAPGEILHARKKENSPVALEQQRQSYLGLKAKLKQMVIVDATCDADQVRRQVMSLIWNDYAARLGATEKRP